MRDLPAEGEGVKPRPLRCPGRDRRRQLSFLVDLSCGSTDISIRTVALDGESADYGPLPLKRPVATCNTCARTWRTRSKNLPAE